MEDVHQVPDLSSLSRIAAHLGTDQCSLSVDEGDTTTVCSQQAQVQLLQGDEHLIVTLTIISSRAMWGTSVRLVIFATKMTLYT
jgi:hypothetical protein